MNLLTTYNFSSSLAFCRFGFNGQEKDNEIAGVGNLTTAQYWEYDTRLGRRWNVDPVDQISISNYAVFANNPIIFSDVNGDEKGDVTKVFDASTGMMMNGIELSTVSISSGSGLINGTGLGVTMASFAGGGLVLPVDNFQDIGISMSNTIGAFFAGGVNAFGSNLMGGFLRMNPNSVRSNNMAFYVGQKFGDAGALVFGAAEVVVVGGGGNVLGAGLDGTIIGIPVGLAVSAASFAVAAHGVITIHTALDNLLTVERVHMSGNNGGGEKPKKTPKSGVSGKEGAKDVPSWAQGERPYVGENGKTFSKRLCDDKYGEGNYSTKSQTEYSKIKKWGDRAFE